MVNQLRVHSRRFAGNLPILLSWASSVSWFNKIRLVAALPRQAHPWSNVVYESEASESAVKIRDRIGSSVLVPPFSPLPFVRIHPRASAPSAGKFVIEVVLRIEAHSVLSVSSCKILP
jgi:hypothetical protein